MDAKFSDVVLLTATQFVRWTLRGAFALVVARVLGPEKFGVYALLFTMVEFLSVASGGGYADYLTRETAKNEHIGWDLGLKLVLLRLGIAVVVLAIEVTILRLLDYPQLVIAGTLWMSLTMVPRSLSEAVQGVLRGICRYVEYLLVESLLGVTLITGGVVLLVRGGGLRGVIATEVIAALASGAVALGFALKLRTPLRIQLKASALIKKSAVFNVYGFMGTLYDRFDVVLLSKLAGDYATGIYSVAYRALGMTQIIGSGVLYSLLPSLSRHSFDKSQQRQLEKAMGLLLNAAFVVVLATMVFAGPATHLVLGARYTESALALKILVWAVIFRYLNYALNIGLLAAGYERVFVVTTSACLAVNFFGNLLLIPRYTWRAAAALTIVTDLLSVIINTYYLRGAVGRMIFPVGAMRSSLAFMLVLGATFAGGQLVSPVLTGTICLLCFFFYLHRSGMLAEFASIWQLRRDPSVLIAP